MKKATLYFLSAIATAGTWACNPATEKQIGAATTETSTPTVATANTDTAVVTDPNTPVMSFPQTEFDFGTIKEGEVVKHVFKFTNTGKSPLVIQNASAPCGCTVPKWPKDPIAPGKTGEIAVEFNSRGKSGLQNKPVTIVANTQPDVTKVTLVGTVEAGVAAMNGPLKP